jgi:uncharacterized protein (DUF362 family)
MKRRDFIRKSLATGLAGSAAISMGNYGKLMAAEANNLPYDLVATKGGEPDVMFDESIKAMGGMGQFIKKGQTVLVKPNIGWDAPPERAANTNPKLVKRVIEHCLNAGASKVYSFDHTCNAWTKCYKNSGIENAVKEAGGIIVPGNSESHYQKVQVPTGSIIKEAQVHELVLDTDVFINIPVLKHHSSAKLTIAMKNLMGIVWDRGFWHKNDLHQCIAEFPAYRKPELNIVDAYKVMKRNGPRGVSTSDVVTMKYLLISSDIVAIDAASAKIFGSDPETIPYITKAHEMNIGNKNLDELNIKRIAL